MGCPCGGQRDQAGPRFTSFLPIPHTEYRQSCHAGRPTENRRQSDHATLPVRVLADVPLDRLRQAEIARCCTISIPRTRPRVQQKSQNPTQAPPKHGTPRRIWLSQPRPDGTQSASRSLPRRAAFSIINNRSQAPHPTLHAFSPCHPSPAPYIILPGGRPGPACEELLRARGGLYRCVKVKMGAGVGESNNGWSGDRVLGDNEKTTAGLDALLASILDIAFGGSGRRRRRAQTALSRGKNLWQRESNRSRVNG